MSATSIRYNDLRETLIRRQNDVRSFLPQFWPDGEREKVILQMATSGTKPNALMLAICAVLAHELTLREYKP